jgi:hypothetical protein
MFDSGAFTKHQAKNHNSYSFINVDDYSNWIEKYRNYCEKYIMLDVIGNESKSKKNYELMVKRGLDPMFVLTVDDTDWSYYRDTLDINPHVCIAGGVADKSDWMSKRFQDADLYGEGKALIHGLGYVKHPTILQLPLHSVDSSSWSQAPLMFGNLMYYDNGLKTANYRDILTKKTKLPQQLIVLFEKLKITPKQFSNMDNHKGGSNIELLTSIIANIEYQKICKRNGLDLFLSTISHKQLKQLIGVNEMLEAGNLTYDKYKKL